MKITVDTMFSHVDFGNDTLLREKVHKIVHRALGIKVDGVQYNSAYRNGYWDGITDFYDMKEDKFHTGLLDQFLGAMRKLKELDPSFTYEIEDVRPAPRVHPDAIDEQIVLGNGDQNPITLRDYQYESVKNALREQVGIVNVATNGGKCLPYFANITTSKGLMTLREFFLHAGEDTDDEGEKVVPYTGDISLLNRYGKLEKPSHLTFNGTRKVREIRGHRGTKNVVTLNHPLLVVGTDGTFVWKQSQDIEVGDFLVGRVGDNVYGSNSLVQSEEEAYVLGAITADGYVNKPGSIVFTSGDTEIADVVENYLLSLTDKSSLYHDKNLKNANRIALNDKKPVEEWHERYGVGYGVAKDKHVPQCILEAPKHIQMAFLSGYLESECSINKQKGCIDVSSASCTLINQVSLMLRNMGFVPTVRKKVVKGYEQNDYYVLALGSTDSIALLEELTFISGKRKKQLEDYYEAVSQRKRNNKKETVPFGKALAESYRESYRKEDIPKGFRKKFTIPKSISKSRLRSLIQEFPNGDQEMLAILKELTSEHYVYEEVVEVKDIGEVPTFDVHMPETHSFIAEGIVNHNTEIASGFMQQVLPYLQRGERIAFFTHSKEIFHQSADRIMKRLNLKPRDIGKIGDGKFDIKNKKIVFVMVPTLVSALKDPKQGIKFTHKERVIKMIAEDITPKFRNTKNTRQLLRNFIKNCKLTTKVWQDVEEHLTYIAYDNKFTDKKAQMQLNKYVVEFDKIMEKKNKNKYKKYKDTTDFLESVTVMIADEVHHSKADTWYTSLSKCTNAIYRVGLTGTVDKKDPMGWQRLQAIFSQVVVRVSNEFLIERGVSSKPKIRLFPVQEPRNIELLNTYLEAYKAGIVENEARNKMIVDIVKWYKTQRPGGILISVKEIDHGDRILDQLKEQGYDAEFIHGGSDNDHRTDNLEKFSKGQLDILVSSTIIDEGVDMKSIGCMVLAAGGKSMRQQLQRVGRGLRLNGIEGNSVLIFDFYDKTNRFLKKHSEERLRIFKSENFDVKILGE